MDGDQTFSRFPPGRQFLSKRNRQLTADQQIINIDSNKQTEDLIDLKL
jgi:hypothetical protein